MTRTRLLLLGACGFIAGVFLLAPAATLYGWSRSDKPAVALELFGLQGTLSSGVLSGAQFGGRPALRDLEWKLQPLWLLLGRASFHISGGDETVVDGGVSVSPLGTVRLRDLRAAGAIKPLLTMAGQAFLPIEGQARLELEQLKLRKGLPQSVEGNLQIQALTWTLARDPLLLGDYRADLTTEGSDSVARLRSVSGPLELSGTARLTAERRYTLELKMKPKPDASAMLRNLVSGAGAPDLQGYYNVRKQGQLVP